MSFLEVAVCQRDIPGVFTWDSYFSNAKIMNHRHEQQDRFDRPRGYVGDLKMNRKVEGKVQRLDKWTAQVAPADKKELHRGDKRQYFSRECFSRGGETFVLEAGVMQRTVGTLYREQKTFTFTFPK